MTIESLLTRTEMTYLCGQPGLICRLAWAGFHLQPGSAVYIPSGTHLQLSVNIMNIAHSSQDNEDIVMMLQQPHVRPTGEQVAHTHRPWGQQTGPLQCKLPEGGVTSDRIYTTEQQPDPHPPEHPEGFIELRLGDVNQGLTELRGIWEHQIIEAEGHLQVMAWYADTERWPRCPEARAVQLPSDLSQWMTRLIEAWDDRADPDEVFHLHMIHPQPQTTFWEEHPAPHVLLIQRPVPNRRSLHFTASDTERSTSQTLQFVDTLAHPVTQSSILQAAGWDDQLGPPQHIQHEIWWGNDIITQEDFAQLRNGNALTVIARHLDDVSSHSSTASEDVTANHVSLLQIQAVRQPVQLTLATLLPIDEEEIDYQAAESANVAIHLIKGAEMGPLPTYIECPSPWCENDVVTELRHWGHRCDVYRFGAHDVALCFPSGWSTEAGISHYMLCHTDTTDPEGSFLHSQAKAMTEVELMSLLYDCGYWRASIQSVEALAPGLFRVQFLNVQVQQAQHTICSRTKPAWPDCTQLIGVRGPYFTPPTDVAGDDCVIGLGFALYDFMKLFTSAENILCRDPAGHDFPDGTRAALKMSTSTCLDDYDRIIVYTDGSSKAKDRHRPPIWNDEQGYGDSWAFVVVGETLTTEEHKVEVLGWTTQPVIYDHQSEHFIGADGIGSYLAEREALAWAAMWRLAQNSSVDTLFRSDSLTSARQALGLMGCSERTLSFNTFRGLFQSLEAALPPGALAVEHIHSHTGEPFNEMADWLARTEREKSFYHPRQRLALKQWLPIIPHMWTLFSQTDGLPSLCANGLHAPIPQLPPLSTPQRCTRWVNSSTRAGNFHLSAGTANVTSLYNGPWGHAGKTDYLRQQFISHNLNFLGLQETRAPETFGQVDGVLRLGSGSARGHFGTELWANLKIPYAWIGRQAHFLKPTDFQVLHRDPRMLAVQIETPYMKLKILVGHAPHCGHSFSEREQWWHTFSNHARLRHDHERLLVLMDANADPGPRDDCAVFTDGFLSNENTPLLQDFLTKHDLCLPATSDCHWGPHDTWVSPNGAHLHCLDHVAVQQCHRHECTYSCVLQDLDLGNGCWDHSATAVQLQWYEQCDIPHKVPGMKPSPTYDIHGLRSQHVQLAIAESPTAPWTQDIESHVDEFNHHLLHGVAKHCPQPQRAPKKPIFTAELWQLRATKLATKKALKDISRRQKHEMLLVCFSALRSRPAVTVDGGFFWQYDTWLLCSRVRAYCKFHCIANQLRGRLRQAKYGQLKDVLSGMTATTPAANILHEVKSLIGPTNLKKVKATTLPYVRNHQGQVCQSPAEALDTWISFFQTMEGGDRLDEHQQRIEWLDNLKRFSATEINLQLSDLPSLTELEAAYRRVQVAKATGPDQVDARLCHLAPAAIAKRTYAILLKTFLHGHECLLHKGGRLHPLWKQKGAKDLCGSFCSILISSHIGKSIHRCLRAHTADIFEKFLQKQQLGGKRRIPVTLGVHQARAYLRSRKQQGLNVGMVFLDLCEAFYRIVREMAMGGITSDETIARMCQRLQLGPDTMRELYQHLDKASAIERAGMPKHLQMVVQAIHSDTHFHLQGQHDHCRTRLGTRPGDCWADFIFSFLWARLLHELEAELKPLDILDSIPQHGGFRCDGIAADPEDPELTGRDDYLGPTWMDDSCFCFAATDPLTLERKAANLCGLLIQRCQSYAMTPNLQPGKTAALLVFQGPGAAAARKKFFGPQTDPSLPVLLEGGVQRVQVVASYVHLGSLLHHRGDMRQEARRRFSIAQGAFQHHRKVLYQNKQLTLQRRAELFRTLILSKFVYGCDSWTLMEKHTRHYVHTSLMKPYRRLLPQAYIKLYSDEEVLQLTGLSDPSDLFRQQRLRHLGALYSCSDSVPWGLLNADTEWTQLVKSDIEWMWHQLRSSSKLPDPHHHFGAWVSLMKDHRRYWKKLVRRAGDHAAAQRDNLFSVTQFHRAILQQLHQAQCLAQGPPLEVRTLAGPAYGCMQCQRKFASRGGCGAHMFRAHGHIHPVRRLFDTTQCGCCLREFHSYGRLKAHLIRADYCRHSLQRRNHYVVPVAGIGSSENDHQERILDGLLPPLPGHGPHLPQGRHGVALDYNLVIFEEIYTRMLEVTSVAEGEAVLRAVASEIPTTWEDFRQTLQALVREATSEDTAVLGISAEDFFGILRRFSLEGQWPFLCEETEVVTEHWHRDLHVLEDFCIKEAQMAHSRQGHARVPRGFGAVRYVLHAFSGRRRCGDFQFYFDRLAADHPDVQLFVISLDVVIDSTWGDISRQDTRDFWLGAINARWVVAIIGGPPCETWSQARERSIAEHAFAPRVLRVPETPWGLPSLRLKELRQIRVGNDLMGFILEAVVMLYCVGGVAALEHPAAPTSEESVSIWRTPILALLLSLPGIELVSLAQGLWGAKSPKPTSFLLVNAPDMRQTLRKWQITRELPKGISIGRDQAGGWSTSVLKEYPPSLNGGLAEGLIAAIGQCTSDPTLTVPTSFVDRCASMMCAEYGMHIGPDFAG